MKRAHLYVLKSFLKNFSSLLIGLWALFFVVDISLRSAALHAESVSTLTFAWFTFLKYLQLFDFFCIFALILASLHTIRSLQGGGELVAFQAGGLSLRSLLRPLTIVGIAVSCYFILHYQVIFPKITEQLATFEHSALGNQKQRFEIKRVHTHQFDNGSVVLFTNAIDQQHLAHFYYVHNDDVWHAESYNLKTHTGEKVTHFRKRNNIMLQEALYEHGSIPVPHLSLSSIGKYHYRNLPISQLVVNSFTAKSPHLRAIYSSYTGYKLAISSLPLLLLPLLLGVGKRFSRTLSRGRPLVFSLIGYGGLYMFLLSAKILSEQEVLSTVYTTGVGLALLGIYSLRTYTRL